MAHELKMHLHAYLGWNGPVTDRQHRAWTAWLRMQWNMPDRSDHYLMQIHTAISRQWAKNPREVTVERSKMTFYTPKPVTVRTRKQYIAASKAYWLGAVGLAKPQSDTDPIDDLE